MPDKALALPLGAGLLQLKERLDRFLTDELYAGLRTDRNARQFDAEIARLAERLSHLDMEPHEIRDLYDHHIHAGEQRALIVDKLLMALPYQVASVVAAQFGLPALAHLPLAARAAAVGVATAAFDEGLQGVVRGTMAQKLLPHHRPARCFPPLLHKLLRSSDPAPSPWGAVGKAVGGITVKNALRTGLSVGAAAGGVSEAGIDSIGAVIDLLGGTSAIAAPGIAAERKDRRVGLQWLLAYDGATSVLQTARHARDAAPASIEQRMNSWGRSVAQTSFQVAKAVPSGLRAAVGPGMWAKGAWLTAVNAGSEKANEWLEEKLGEARTPDVSARRRRSDEEPAIGNSGIESAGTAPEPAEAPVPRGRELEHIAAEEAVALALGAGATFGTFSTDMVKERLSGPVWAPGSHSSVGLRQRRVRPNAE